MAERERKIMEWEKQIKVCENWGDYCGLESLRLDFWGGGEGGEKGMK